MDLSAVQGRCCPDEQVDRHLVVPWPSDLGAIPAVSPSENRLGHIKNINIYGEGFVKEIK